MIQAAQGEKLEVRLGEFGEYLEAGAREKVEAEVRRMIVGGLLDLIREAAREHPKTKRYHYVYWDDDDFDTNTLGYTLYHRKVEDRTDQEFQLLSISGDKSNPGVYFVESWHAVGLEDLREDLRKAREAHREALVRNVLVNRRNAYVLFGLAERVEDVPPPSDDEIARLMSMAYRGNA